MSKKQALPKTWVLPHVHKKTQLLLPRLEKTLTCLKPKGASQKKGVLLRFEKETAQTGRVDSGHF